MFWSSVQSANMPAKASAILGFNEPNFKQQANLTPKQAADMWPKIEAAAKQRDVPIIVGPAVNFAPVGQTAPIKWLDDFFSHCVGCRVDAIAMHSYTCRWTYLKTHLDMYSKHNIIINQNGAASGFDM